MKLWLLTQEIATGYDTYDSCVVVADTEELAKDMHPCTYDNRFLSEQKNENQPTWYWDWAQNLADVTATCLGDALDPTRRVVCSSFNAG